MPVYRSICEVGPSRPVAGDELAPWTAALALPIAQGCRAMGHGKPGSTGLERSTGLELPNLKGALP